MESRRIYDIGRQRLRAVGRQYAFQPTVSYVVDHEVFRQQSYAETAERGAAYRLVVVRADHTADNDASGSFRTDQAPLIVAWCYPAHDTVVIRQVTRLPRPTTPPNIIRRGDSDAPYRAEASLDQRKARTSPIVIARSSLSSTMSPRRSCITSSTVRPG